MQTIAVINQKGGVAKTTTTVNLAVGLADTGARVLAIDLDPQAHLTLGLGIDPADIRAEQTVARVFYETDALLSLCLPTPVSSLRVLPASIALALAVESLYSVIFRETKLKKALAGVRDRYDYVLLDSGPNLGVLSVNAIAAADKILVPTRLSLYALGGLSDLLQTVQTIRDGGDAPDIRILLTMVKGGAPKRQEAAHALLEPLKERVLQTRIRESEAIERSQMEDSESGLLAVVREGGANRGAQDYQALTREILGLWPVT